MRYPNKKGKLQVRRVLCLLPTTASIPAPTGQLKCGLRCYRWGRVGKGADRPGSRLHKQTLQTLALAGSQLFASLLYVCNMILEGKSVAKSESLTIKLVQPTKTERGGRERELGVFKGEFPYQVPSVSWSTSLWKSLSRVWLFATSWTVQSMELSKPEYWSG